MPGLQYIFALLHRCFKPTCHLASNRACNSDCVLLQSPFVYVRMYHSTEVHANVNLTPTYPPVRARAVKR